MLLPFVYRPSPGGPIWRSRTFPDLNTKLSFNLTWSHPECFVIGLRSPVIGTSTRADFRVWIGSQELLHSISCLLLMRSSSPLFWLLNQQLWIAGNNNILFFTTITFIMLVGIIILCQIWLWLVVATDLPRGLNLIATQCRLITRLRRYPSTIALRVIWAYI